MLSASRSLLFELDSGPRRNDGLLAQRRAALRRETDRAPVACAEAFRQPIRETFPHGEVHNFFDIDDIACHRFNAAVVIHQSHFHAALAVPHQAAEGVRRFLEALAAPLLYHVDELLMDFGEHLFGVFMLRRVGCRERIDESFFFSSTYYSAF